MRIAMIGAGYVGLVSGACFAEFGVDVTVMDVDPAKIDGLRAGIMPIYEPGLDKLVAENARDGRLTFTTDLAQAVRGADAVFLAVGTPTRRGDGHADLTYVYAAAEQVAKAAEGPLVLVTKSTVPVGTGREVQAIVRRVRPDLPISVASNPEFLREGSAIGDFMRPDRVVIGVDDERALTVLKRLYRPLYLIETPVLAVSIESAELIKYAANAFLATKITFINEIADLCEKVGADVHDVARGMGLDGRIGRKFLHPGPGYGGSCFPKDTLALARTAQDAGVPVRLVETTIAVNESRKAAMADRILAALGPEPAGKRVGVLGVTFKPETDDMRDAPSLVILPRLVAAGVEVSAYDPQPAHAREALPAAVRFADSALGAAEGADAVVVLTEWNEFRALSPDRLKAAMKGGVILDLRNVWDPVAMRAAGLAYSSIGRP
ncbi:UDP-glucose dehydrogenase family protein [Neoroseomonas soli]|uniref:UDP-glucose 6-dehydrogenase n=1 Tax=Neoroseomonas soli TaxID=1081025 RepID=A0A9X9X0D7_9PROT|nr:UDP-glucose/GDP-mannose dehydrogenase family protein [Neoroseomonas soli]MBR0672866.1 UDP-glucose/GDP-mannose dehydrogenase family protein [Neoroseomonas soli]